MECRLVVAQTNPTLGDLRANLADHLARIDAAVGAADLILFPELSLTGYFLRDQVEDVALRPEDALLAPLLERSRQISIAFGFVERSPEGRLYNALGFLEDGRFLGIHRKVHLVSYGLFDEGRDFAAGQRFQVIASRHGRFGPLICEDMWHMPSAYSYFLDDADALLVASASPARGAEQPGPGLASERTWNLLLSASALLYRTWVAFASRVGWEDGLGFSGGSRVLDPHANTRAALAERVPGTLTALLDSGTLRRARSELPLRRDERPDVLAAALARHVPLLAALRAEHALQHE
jgi:NAD+ synthase (glutamine-hydrolysing)